MLRGRAAFTSPREVAVDGRALRAQGFVLATGSRPAVPPLPGLAGRPYLTNENVFELDALPASLAVLGGGAVGCQLAQAFGRLGAAVTVIEAAPRLLPAADPATSALIGEIFAREGVTVRTGAPVEKINNGPNDPGFTLHLHNTQPVLAGRLLWPPAANPSPMTWGWTGRESGWMSVARSSPTAAWPRPLRVSTRPAT